MYPRTLTRTIHAVSDNFPVLMVIQTYIQRDVQDVLKVSDQTAFNRFLAAVAARTGQMLNYASLSRDVDIDNKTAKAWLSVLETSGLVYLLQPYHSNLTKRLVKAPKLYFLVIPPLLEDEISGEAQDEKESDNGDQELAISSVSNTAPAGYP